MVQAVEYPQSDGGAKGSGYVRLGNGTNTNCGIAIAKMLCCMILVAHQQIGMGKQL